MVRVKEMATAISMIPDTPGTQLLKDGFEAQPRLLFWHLD
jgi:hypothetical protein